MSVRNIAFFAIALAILGAITFVSLRPRDQSLLQAEIQRNVRQYDDAIYLNADYESAKNAANNLLTLSGKSEEPNVLQVRGLIRLAYLEIVSGKWGNQWKRKIKTCQSLVSQKPTIDRAELLLYLGGIRGKWQSRFDEGLEKIQEALWIANHIKDDRTLSLAYTKLSELHVFSDQPTLVAKNAYRGLTVAKSHGEKSIIVRAYRNLVDDLLYLDKIPEAAECGERLLEYMPESVEAMYVLYLAGKSNDLQYFVDNRVAEVEKLEEDGGKLGHRPTAKFGKLLARSAIGYLKRNEFAKCLERAEMAIPYLRCTGDQITLSACLKISRVAQVAMADDVEQVDKIAAEFGEDESLPEEVLTLTYAKLGEPEKSLYWKQRVLEHKENRQGSEIGFLQQSSELYWESELKLRKQTALTRDVVANSSKRVWFLSTVLVLGLTVCALLSSFYFLLRRERNLLENTVKSRTMSLSNEMKKANAADLAKSDFLAQINHEIRNPLTAILSYCDLLSYSPDDERSSEFVAGIESSSQHLRKLVDEILEVSKIESSELKAVSVEFFPQQSLNDINGTMFEQATQKGISLNCVFKGNREASILSDEKMIRQIALNLIGNAIKFTDKGEVTVTFELNDQDDADNAKLTIVVDDSGVGIPKNELSSIFDRFTKATNAGAREGSGLGLYIARQLVSCLNGEILLNSELGVGTNAIVSLPVKVSNGHSASLQTRLDPGTAGLKDPSFKSSKRVLVVDDQEMIRISLKLQLEASGLDCETTDTLERTIEIVESWSPDLVLLDLRMPKHSGFEVLEEIRQSNNAKIPVIAITGDATELVRQKCESYGFDGFITKPFMISVILEVLDSHNDETSTAALHR